MPYAVDVHCGIGGNNTGVELPKLDGKPYIKTDKGARNHPCTVWANETVAFKVVDSLPLLGTL